MTPMVLRRVHGDRPHGQRAGQSAGQRGEHGERPVPESIDLGDHRGAAVVGVLTRSLPEDILQVLDLGGNTVGRAQGEALGGRRRQGDRPAVRAEDLDVGPAQPHGQRLVGRCRGDHACQLGEHSDSVAHGPPPALPPGRTTGSVPAGWPEAVASTSCSRLGPIGADGGLELSRSHGTRYGRLVTHVALVRLST